MVRCCTVRCAPNFEGEEGRRNQRTRVRGQLLVWLVAGLQKISSQRVKKLVAIAQKRKRECSGTAYKVCVPTRKDQL